MERLGIFVPGRRRSKPVSPGNWPRDGAVAFRRREDEQVAREKLDWRLPFELEPSRRLTKDTDDGVGVRSPLIRVIFLSFSAISE